MVCGLIISIYTPSCFGSPKIRSEKLDALGRPFRIGMLYDRRSDQLIVGRTLWGPNTLLNTTKHPLPSSHFEVGTSSTYTERINLFHISAELTISLLFGLAEFSAGATEYFRKLRKSHNYVSASLLYTTTTYYEGMHMDSLSNIEYPEVLQDKQATDVVVGITYGTRSSFMFDRKIIEVKKDEYEISSGLLKGLLRKLAPAIKGDYSGENAMKYKCELFTDLVIRKKPSTYNEAIELIKRLPKVAANQSKYEKPLYVYILPIDELDINRETSLKVFSIGKEIIQPFFKAVSDIEHMMIFIDTALASLSQPVYKIATERYGTFKYRLDLYKKDFESNVKSAIPAVRRGNRAVSELERILKRNNNSPFNVKSVHSWFNQIETMTSIISAHVKADRQLSFITSREFKFIFASSTVKYVFCIILEVFFQNDLYLKLLKHYLNRKKGVQSKQSKTPAEPYWYNNITLSLNLNRNLKDTIRLISLNRMNSEMKFSFLNEPLENNKYGQSMTYLYSRNNQAGFSFQVPSEIGKPVGKKITMKSIELTWNAPKLGVNHVLKYVVRYSNISKLCFELLVKEKAEEYSIGYLQSTSFKFLNSSSSNLSRFIADCRDLSNWKKVDSSGTVNNLVIQSLSPNTTYVFFVEAICEFGSCSRSGFSKRLKTLSTTTAPKLLINCQKEEYVEWKNKLNTCNILRISDKERLEGRLSAFVKKLIPAQKKGMYRIIDLVC